MTGEINIRHYQPEDRLHLIILLKMNVPEYFDISEIEDFIYYLDSELEDYYIIEIDRKILGCGGVNYFDNCTMARISWDIFHPAYQGKGLGTRLLKYRIEKIREKNIKEIIVRTSQLAYKFYEKNGFCLIEVVKDYWAVGYDMYHMKYGKC